MPNRILKESICTSENIDQLTPMAEIAFYRLMVNCDDYGRMDGRVKIIKSKLFPLKDVSENEMLKLLTELERAELISSYEVDGKRYLQMKTWDKHQQVRAKRSKYPSADENICNQMISDDIKCPRNPIQSLSKSESLSESLINADDAHEIQVEQDLVLNAADNAGFARNDATRAQLIRMYADNGLQKMIDGIESCVMHGAPNLAYLKAVLKGEPRKAKAYVNAQKYTQRDYGSEQNEAMERMLRIGGVG